MSDTTHCGSCGLDYPSAMTSCPQCRERVRQAAGTAPGRRQALRKHTAYPGTRVLLGLVTALSLIGSALILYSASQGRTWSVELVAFGVASALLGLLQLLLGNAILDAADAALCR